MTIYHNFHPHFGFFVQKIAYFVHLLGVSGRCEGQHTVDLRTVVLERSNTWTDEVLERSNSCGATVLDQVF